MSDSWVKQLAGRFVVFDGPDGSGKTTQFHRFAALARSAGLDVREVREPGGTAIGERIRSALLDPEHGEMDLRCEMLLYMASRAQLVAERIRPAIQAGALVLADRFISSTLAYQGTAGGLPTADIARVADVAVGDCSPDLVVLFDVDAKTAAHRLNPLLDRMEQRGVEFHQRVRTGFHEQAREDPRHHLLLDARPDSATVFERLRRALAERFAADA